jgi:hypothetical protein
MASKSDDWTYTPAPAADEGWKIETPPTIGEDIAGGAKSGAANALAGIPGKAGDWQRMLFDWLGPKLGLKPEQIEAAKQYKGMYPTSEEIKGATGLDKYNYDPQWLIGKGAKNIAEFSGGMAGSGASTVPGVLGNIGKFVVAPGVATTAADELAPGNPYARVAAGALAPGVAHVVASPGHVINTIKKTPDTLEEYLQHVDNLKQAGFKKFTAGEATNAPAWRAADEALLPGRFRENREAITNKATGQVTNGEGGTFQTGALKPTKGDTPGTVDQMLTNIKDRFAKNTYDADAALNEGLGNIRTKYGQNPDFYGKDVVGAVDKYTGDINSGFRGVGIGGQMSGEKYHQLLTDLRHDRIGSDNTKRVAALQEIEDQLTANMRRSVEKNAPLNLKQHDQLEADLRNATAIRLAMHSNADHLSPGALHEAAQAVNGGRSNPYDWAGSAKEVFSTAKPTSEAANKLHAFNEKLGAVAGGAGGAGLGAMAPPLVAPLWAIGGGLGGAGTGHIVGPWVLKPTEKAIYKASTPLLRSEQWRVTDKPYRSAPGLLTQSTNVQNAPPDQSNTLEELQGLLGLKKRKLAPMPATLD